MDHDKLVCMCSRGTILAYAYEFVCGHSGNVVDQKYIYFGVLVYSASVFNNILNQRYCDRLARPLAEFPIPTETCGRSRFRIELVRAMRFKDRC